MRLCGVNCGLRVSKKNKKKSIFELTDRKHLKILNKRRGISNLNLQSKIKNLLHSLVENYGV
jgi:hypothetical protein